MFRVGRHKDSEAPGKQRRDRTREPILGTDMGGCGERAGATGVPSPVP